ncbi:MAG TPA: PilZ domain-containing protein [Allosphingosinicella sp.]|nr:PilZ domain-containing protein [Allosphingosinicella sp.]
MRALGEKIGIGQARSEPRFPVFLPATIRSGPCASRVHLRDLSRSGALAESLRPPPPGSPVTLARDGLLVEAEVVWVGGMRFGLQFATPLEATELLVQLSRSRAAA